MNRLIIAGMAALCMLANTVWAYRVLEQPEEGYELVLADIEIPRSATGSIRFRPCDGCTAVSFRVANTTLYFANGSPLVFMDFFEAASRFRGLEDGGDNTVVYVFVNKSSGLVSRLMLDHFHQ